MRSLLSFTIEHFLIFQATLLQYAAFVTADSSSSNWSANSSLSACHGCRIVAPRSLLSYPGEVSEVTKTQSVTVVPFVVIYETGGNVTSWGTYTKYSSNDPSQGLAPSPTPLTWETYGTTLTYPTTYIAYPNVSAAVSTAGWNQCNATYTTVSLATSEIAQLIFPYANGTTDSDSDTDTVTSSAASIIDTLPSISALVSPNLPAACTHAVGTGEPESAVPAATLSVAAVMHTSVRYLTTPGQVVITRSSGSAPPPAESQTQGGGGGGSNGGQGGGQGSQNNDQQSTPVFNWGSSTITEGPGGVFNFGGQSLTAGGAAQTIDGTTISVFKGGSSAVVNGHTTSLTNSPVQATGGAVAQVPVPIGTWFAGASVGFLGLVLGMWL